MLFLKARQLLCWRTVWRYSEEPLLGGPTQLLAHGWLDLVALYGLTPAEANVCGWIVQGLSINDIAKARSMTPITAKNQVAAILAKIGVGRWAELIRLVIRVLPPVK